MEFIENNSCQYDYKYLKLYKKKDPSIINYSRIRFNISIYNNYFINVFNSYYFILNN